MACSGKLVEPMTMVLVEAVFVEAAEATPGTTTAPATAVPATADARATPPASSRCTRLLPIMVPSVVRDSVICDSVIRGWAVGGSAGAGHCSRSTLPVARRPVARIARSGTPARCPALPVGVLLETVIFTYCIGFVKYRPPTTSPIEGGPPSGPAQSDAPA